MQSDPSVNRTEATLPDIVARLRDRAHWHGEIENEAADEIERLRAFRNRVDGFFADPDIQAAQEARLHGPKQAFREVSD